MLYFHNNTICVTNFNVVRSMYDENIRFLEVHRTVKLSMLASQIFEKKIKE